MYYNLHAVIELPQLWGWGTRVRQAVDNLLLSYPRAETKVTGRQLIIDLRGHGDPSAAITALQAVGLQLNPSGLTVVEASDGVLADTSAAPWTGYHAVGPSWVVSAWLAAGAKLDRQLNYAGPVAVQLRYLPISEEASA